MNVRVPVVVQQGDRRLGRQTLRVRPLGRVEVGNPNRLGEITVDGTELFQVLDELLKRLHLPFEGRGGDRPAAEFVVFVNIVPTEVADPLDADALAPLDEELQSVLP